VSLDNIIASSVPDPLIAHCTPMQTASDPGTTSAALSSDVVADMTGVPISSSIQTIQGNGTTLPGIPDPVPEIHGIASSINIEVPQAVTAHSSGADIHRTSGA
jgi:hypothetical protein